MKKTFTTHNSNETQRLGRLLAEELRGGGIICMTGELGTGKTTFTQGLLKGLKIKGPYTSPTFVIMKKYADNIYHFDAYRVGVSDVLNLGWEEIVADKNNLVIIEWAERIGKIIPNDSLWIEFSWVGEEERKITFKSK
ncbi:MAG: tRNA (adenosine(37)-N6)-threonylcarbamoyltransferase complex ATPase subunit type 1 TsaE [Candidatus Pacebacteria bacterium]|nr:tRNA (adenosine(37)-N6)-threonylcarbamoyltransferase complex ATPase subunit type 1 TsaE [Candidatus Paceibacterota bacterium]MDR3583278.1 tRNA (adenosine(37)-N6)-threonylcarbamoyltransferase complex ATPase subunit type 1 TsaE [Candidatus Paceibacterota bacterium]